MRTVTFMGLMTIGGALRNIAEMTSPDNFITIFLGIVLLGSIFMDVCEFIKKIEK